MWLELGTFCDELVSYTYVANCVQTSVERASREEEEQQN
jgi:hypothetical protein